MLFFQCCLLFPLIYFGERYARVGQGGDCTGEGASPGSRENTKQHEEKRLNKTTLKLFLIRKLKYYIQSGPLISEQITFFVPWTQQSPLFLRWDNQDVIEIETFSLQDAMDKIQPIGRWEKKFAMCKTSGVM